MKVSFAFLLCAGNLLLIFFLIFLFFSDYSLTKNYINNLTITSGILLCTFEILFINKNKDANNPFSYILSLLMLIGFSSRIITLGMFGESPAFWRFNYSVIELNNFIVFLIIANILMHYTFIKSTIKKKYTSLPLKNIKPNILAIFFGLLLLINYGPFFNDLRGLQANFPSLFYVFADPRIYLLFITGFLVVYFKKISLYTKSILILLIFLNILLSLSCGSRSDILYLSLSVFLFLLATENFEIELTFRRLTIFLIFISLSVLFFSAGSYTRHFGCRQIVITDSVVYSPELKISKAYHNTFTKSFDNFSYHNSGALISLSTRLAFLDYGYDIYANSAKYKNIINIKSYYKSIVDNLLTPGFDIFDQPKIKNTIPFAYNADGRIQPNKLYVAKNYSSDMMTIYGEFFLFLNYFSYSTFVIVSLVLNKIYYSLRRNTFTSILASYFILNIFFDLVIGFGIDDLIIKNIVFLPSFYIFNLFLRKYGSS